MPRHGADGEVADGHRAAVPIRQLQDVDVRSQRAHQPGAVGLVPEPVDDHRSVWVRRRGRVCHAANRLRRDVPGCDERDPGAVRRPHRRSRTERQLGDLLRLAGVGHVQQVQLAGVTGLAQEGEPGAVG